MSRVASKILFLACGLAMASLWSAPASADAHTEAILADQALMAALAAGDKQAAGALIDPLFTWTAGDGATRKKVETLDRLDDVAANNKNESDTQAHFYGNVL